MIIAHYEHDIWANGGLATYICRISQAQRAAGHTVYHFSKRSSSPPDNSFAPPHLIQDEEDLFRQAKALDVEILHLHRSIAKVPPPSLPTVLTLHEHTPYCPSGGRYLKRQQCPCDRAYSFTGCLWGHFVDRCGSIRPHRMAANFQRTWQEMSLLEHIPVITVSQFLKDQMIRSGYRENNIQVIPHFAPQISDSLQSFPPKTSTPHFVFLGRLTPEKGARWLIEAFSQVSVPCHLDIAGDGYEMNELKQLAIELAIQDRISFRGWVSEEDIAVLLANSRAAIFPSLWHEPAGLVAFEAMAYSRPVIASKVGGIEEFVIDNVNGLTVASGDRQYLTQMIERLASNWSLAKKLGITGNQLAIHQYSLDIHMENLINFYRKQTSEKS